MAEENLDQNVDAAEGPYTEEEGKKVSGGLVKILMMAAVGLVAAIVMVIISVIVFNVMNKGGGKAATKVLNPSVQKRTPPRLTMPLKALKLNLNDPTGTNPVFLRVEMALAYEKMNEKLQAELTERKFEIRDKVITLISSKTHEDVNSPEKIELLKKEIKNQINTLLINGLIEDVYILEFNVVPRS